MAAELRVVEVALTVEVATSPEPFRLRFGLSPMELGERLADQVMEQARLRRLGYFPPLEFFIHQEGVDQGLLRMAEEMGRFACQWVGGEARNRVAHAFSRLEIRHLHTTAFTMPAVRPGRADSRAALAAHYAPDTVRVELRVATLEKGEPAGLDRLAARKVVRWLGEGFERVTVPVARLVGE